MHIPYPKKNALPLPAGPESDPFGPHSALPVMDWALAAAPGNDGGGGAPAGGKPENRGQESKKPTTPEPPQSITDADSPLTGDTGNLELGQTDLGASGTGSEDPLAADDQDA